MNRDKDLIVSFGDCSDRGNGFLAVAALCSHCAAWVIPLGLTLLPPLPVLQARAKLFNLFLQLVALALPFAFRRVIFP